MSDLIVVSFNDPIEADEVLLRLQRMQREHLIDLEDAVVASRDADGQVRIRQSYNLTALGAASGSMWGTLVGLVFLNPLLGLAAGAASGALAGYVTDIGIDDGFIREVADSLPPNSSAIFLLVRRATPDKVLAEFEGSGGRVLRTSLSRADEERLQAVLQAKAAEHNAPVADQTPPAVQEPVSEPTPSTGAPGGPATQAL